MKKKNLIIGISAGAVIVALVIILPLTLGQKAPEPSMESSSQSTIQPQSSKPAALPVSSSTPPPVSASESDSIPYVGPVDKAIVGVWERHIKRTIPVDPSSSVDPTIPVFTKKYEFAEDGTFIFIQYDVLDEEYPENWEFKMYNYTFDTFRGEDVLYCAFFARKAPLYYKFYTWEDGRDALDIWQQERDGSMVEYSNNTYLRLED